MKANATSTTNREWPCFSAVMAIPSSVITTMKSLFAVTQTPHLIISISVPYLVRELLWLKLTDIKATNQNVEYSKTRIGPMRSKRNLMASQRYTVLHFGS